MIRKIVFPTDFSEAANNATEYAARLAQVFGASLTFINVQTISVPAANISMGEGIGAEARTQAHEAAEKMKLLCETVKNSFDIETNYEVDITMKSFVSILDTHTGVDEMIVMGTDGADGGMYQFFFGTNTFHVVQHAKCPVLVIPMDASYKDIKKVVFAWNEASGGKQAFSHLIDYLKPFAPEYVFLHISKNRNEHKEEVFKSLQDEVANISESENGIKFKQVFADDVTFGLTEYVDEVEADVLVLTHHDRGLLGNLFSKKIVRDITEIASFPILVLHE